MVDDTTLEVDDLVRKIAIPGQRSHSIAVAAGIMQMLILRGFKEILRNEKRRNLVKFLFSETMLLEYSPFSVINHQNRSTPPLEQLRNSTRNPTSTETAISQPLALPSPSEPSRSILIQAPSDSIFEACDSSQDYWEESTGETTRRVHSKRI